MIKNAMTIRSAGSTTPPKQANATIKSAKAVGAVSAKKIWKTLVAAFKVAPTKAELKSKQATVLSYYKDAAKLYEAGLREGAKDNTIRIKVVVNWENITPLQYFIIVLMLRVGPGNDSVNPPQSPTPPKSPL